MLWWVQPQTCPTSHFPVELGLRFLSLGSNLEGSNCPSVTDWLPLAAHHLTSAQHMWAAFTSRQKARHVPCPYDPSRRTLSMSMGEHALSGTLHWALSPRG